MGFAVADFLPGACVGHPVQHIPREQLLLVCAGLHALHRHGPGAFTNPLTLLSITCIMWHGLVVQVLLPSPSGLNVANYHVFHATRLGDDVPDVTSSYCLCCHVPHFECLDILANMQHLYGV